MITAIDIIRTFTEKLEEILPDYPVRDRDVEESIDRPSAVIDLRSTKTQKRNVLFADEYEFTIYVFTEDRHKGYLELLEINKALRFTLDESIECSQHEGFYFDFLNVEYYINRKDHVLQVSGQINIVQDDDRTDDTPEATELQFSLQRRDIAGDKQGTIAENMLPGEDDSDIEDF